MPDLVELIPQDKSNACWLASSTMMRSWKDSKSYPISDTLMILDGAWGNFSQTYNADKGLSFNDNKKIVETLGLTSLPPASYTIDYFFSLLDYSPIMAVIMFSASSNIAHMVVITAITGDRTPDGSMLQINDPLPLNSGHTYSISFSDFLNKFESVVAYENKFGVANLTSQLFYYASTGDAAGNSSTNSSDSSGGSSDDSSNTSDTSADTSDSSTSSSDSSGDADSSTSSSDSSGDADSSTSSSDSSGDTDSSTSSSDSAADSPDNAASSSDDTSNTDSPGTSTDESTTDTSSNGEGNSDSENNS